jgi:hypothetical protein
MDTNAISKANWAITNEEKKQREKASKALSNARQRCNNPLNKDYSAYGGQGIKVLLTSVDELIGAIGLPPLNGTLDRIDPNGHYEASNVRWATKAVQVANKKSSPAGSTLPLHTLIAQQKVILQQEEQRPKATEAWHLLVSARNVACLTQTVSARLVELLDLHGTPHEILGQHDTVVDGYTQTIFRMPSLTFPGGFVDARGPLSTAPDAEIAERYTRSGLLFGLRNLDSQRNVPAMVRKPINELLKEPDCPGIAFIGRPSQDDLPGGWFEVWMLAAATRLPSALQLSTAFFPALTCLHLLNELGSPTYWDEVTHPLLDSALLFVPDFQLDCGPWGALGPYQYGMFERLLRYRIECGHQTVVGVQAPHKLSPGLQKILLAHFEAQVIPSGTKPQLM